MPKKTVTAADNLLDLQKSGLLAEDSVIQGIRLKAKELSDLRIDVDTPSVDGGDISCHVYGKVILNFGIIDDIDYWCSKEELIKLIRGLITLTKVQ